MSPSVQDVTYDFISTEPSGGLANQLINGRQARQPEIVLGLLRWNGDEFHIDEALSGNDLRRQGESSNACCAACAGAVPAGKEFQGPRRSPPLTTVRSTAHHAGYYTPTFDFPVQYRPSNRP